MKARMFAATAMAAAMAVGIDAGLSRAAPRPMTLAEAKRIDPIIPPPRKPTHRRNRWFPRALSEADRRHIAAAKVKRERKNARRLELAGRP